MKNQEGLIGKRMTLCVLVMAQGCAAWNLLAVSNMIGGDTGA